MKKITYLNDSQLSWKEKGLLTFMRTYPNETNYESLVSESSDGITSLQNGLKELTMKGYYYNYPIRDKMGKFIYFTQNVRYERHIPENSAEKDIINAVIFTERWNEKDDIMLRNAISIVKSRNPENYLMLKDEIKALFDLGHPHAKFVLKSL